MLQGCPLMRIENLGNVHIHWREDGDADGPAVVFANSLGCDLRLWDKVVALMPKGLRLVRFDKRGHGLSSCPAPDYSMDDLVDDAAMLLDRLQVSKCVFIGLSIGGMIAQGLAARRPDLIGALVLSNTAAKMGTAEIWQERMAAVRDGGIEALADQTMERWFSAGFRATDELEGWRNMLVRTPVAGYLGCCAAIAGADLHAATSALTLPAIGIAGTVDGSSPPDIVHATVELIPGAQCHVIEGAGHLPCVEAPRRYADILKGFLSETGHVPA